MAEYVCELPIEGMVSFVSGTTTIPVHERIVRCMDCKRVTIDQGDHDYREPLWCGLFHIDVSLDGFCKWCERKEDDA